ncbi:MAG: FG-GAP-like repeat-containing protein, partial [Nitrospirota bacterium]|nr:FG-GAP-like repeat-containing protein [Nitrospirota bacterium]
AAENAPDGSRYYVILNGDVRKGDTARVTSSRVKLAFFQDRRSDWELSEEFYGALKNSGRFEILEAYTPSFGTGDLSAASRELGAEAFIVFSTPLRDRKRFVNVRLYWAEDAGMLGEFEDIAGRNADAASMPVTGFLSEDITGTQPLAGFQLTEGKLIAAGDVDGNGSDEVIVSNGRVIRIYNLKNDGLNELWQITGAPTERHISIDVLDLNNNGIAEIFVTSLIWSGNVRSYVLEYDHAGYTRIGDGMPYFLRVDGNSLLMQKSSLSRPFSGPVHEGEWKDGGYGAGRPLDLPAGVNVFGFTYIDWQNKGLRQLISYDDSGHLTLYDENGAPLWKSETTYGISGSFNRDPHSISDSDESVVVRGGLQTVRTERGQELIVIKRIPNVSLMPGFGFKGCEVYSLWWNGASMEEKLVLKDISGTATDYRINTGKMFMFVNNSVLTLVKNAVSGEFYKGSVLYYYDFGVK